MPDTRTDTSLISAREILEKYSSEEICHSVTQLPVDAIFLLDLTVKEVDGKDRFVRVVVPSARSILEFMAAQDISAMKITALQARSAEHPEARAETVVEFDALPPQLFSYTLESGERFAIVGHSEPKRMWPLIRSAADENQDGPTLEPPTTTCAGGDS